MKIKIEETEPAGVPSIVDLGQPKDDDDIQEVCQNVWRALSLVRPGRGVHLPADGRGVAEDDEAHGEGPGEGDEETRPPGSHPERVTGLGLHDEVSVEGEELAAQHVAQRRAHYEGGLEDRDVERGAGPRSPPGR